MMRDNSVDSASTADAGTGRSMNRETFMPPVRGCGSLVWQNLLTTEVHLLSLPAIHIHISETQDIRLDLGSTLR
nr:hypothetical protein CFP56_09899 [Quercus suber]